MKSFGEGFYTNDYGEDMLDFIENNYPVDREVRGWEDTNISLCYSKEDRDFYLTGNNACHENFLTKEKFKEKIGMNSRTSDKSVFTKDMLKDGMFVKVRNGGIYIKLGSRLLQEGGFLRVGNYKDNLTLTSGIDEFTIDEVFSPEYESVGSITLMKCLEQQVGLTSIWKRPTEKTPLQKAIEENIAIAKQRLLELEKLLEENS